MLGTSTGKALLQGSYNLATTTKATIEWNHNVYNSPRISGTVCDSVADSTIPQLTNFVTLTEFGKTFSSTSYRGANTYGGYAESFSFSNLARIKASAFSFPSSKSYSYKMSFYVKLTDSTAEAIMLHFSELNSGGNEIGGSSRAFTADSIDWQLHHIIYSPSNPLTTKVNVYLSTQQDQTGTGSGLYISDFTICKTNSSEYEVYPSFNTESVFQGFRPGDELAETSLSTDNKPLSKIIYSGIGKQKVYGSPTIYKGTSILSTTESSNKLYFPGIDSLQYYAYKQSYSNVSQGVFAYYDKTLTVNKLVIKMLNSGPGTLNSYYNNTIIDYDIYTYTSSTNTWTNLGKIGTMKKNGSLILYWNGTSWTGSADSATINETNYTLSNTTTIDGIAFIVKDMGSTNTSMSSMTDTSNFDPTVRFLEISPRLIIDFSNYIESFSASKETDSGNLPVPVGLASSNNAELILENLSRTYNGTTFGLFSDKSKSVSPITKLNLIEKNAKVRIKFDLKNSDATSQDTNISFFTGYVDSWEIDESSANIKLFDYSKFLQKKINKNILLLDIDGDTRVSYVITEMLEQNGFSDYNEFSLKDTHLQYYNTNDQKTIWESIQELCLPYQIIGNFDEDGLFSLYTYKSKSVKANDTDMNFIFTDKNNDSNNGYLSNIIKLTQNNGESPGKIIVDYNKSYKKNSVSEGSNNYTTVLNTTTQSVWSCPDGESLGYSVLRESLGPTDNFIQLNNALWNTNKETGWQSYSGYAVIGTEIIKYNGIQIVCDSTYYTVKSQSELNYITSTLIKNSESTGTSAKWSYTGKLMNVERGMFGTNAQPHVASNKISDISSAYPSLKTSKVTDILKSTSQTLIANNATALTVKGKDDVNFLCLNGQATGIDTVLYFDGEDSDSYNDYYYHFYMPTEKTNQDDLVSFHIGYDKTNPKNCLTVQFVTDSYNSSGTKKTAVYYQGRQIATSSFKLDNMDPKVVTTRRVHGKVKKVTKKAVLNKYINVHIHLTDNKKLSISVNHQPVKFDREIVIEKLSRASKSIGLSVKGLNRLFIDSIYASDFNSFIVTKLNERVNLNPILYNGYSSSSPFFFSNYPSIYGMQIFDVITSGPSFNQYVLKTLGAHEIKNTDTTTTLYQVTEGSSSVSQVAHNPFKSKFIAVNLCESYIPISGTDKFNKTGIYANALIKTENQQYIRELDNQYSNANDLQVSSDWIQDDNTAKDIASTLVNQIKISGNTIDVETFGNPLLTVGDIVKILYYQQNIVDTDQYYMITKSDITYDNGFNSSFTLRRIK